jgi:AAA family ATP:ADP antiporter
MMLVGAMGLVSQLQVTAYVERRERGRSPVAHEAAEEQPPRHNAFGLVSGNPYLLFIGIMLMLFYLVDATGEYILGSIITDRATELVASGRSGGLAVEELIGTFYSRYFALINLASLLLQLFLVSRLVKYLGVGTSICILPALSVLAYGLIAFVPNLWLTLGAKVGEKSTDYSLNNTVRNMLFLPCTREEKYSAKQVIDSLFVRLGDVGSAALVFIGTTMLGLTSTGFAQVNILLAGAGLTVALLVGRIYSRLTSHPIKARAPSERPAWS